MCHNQHRPGWHSSDLADQLGEHDDFDDGLMFPEVSFDPVKYQACQIEQQPQAGDNQVHLFEKPCIRIAHFEKEYNI